MNLIFLDVDGVLNRHEMVAGTGRCRIEAEYADRFSKLLHETEAAFVVSSAWRYLVHGGAMTVKGLEHLFTSHGIDGRRMVGITRPDCEISQCDRGVQITEWVRDYGKEFARYVVIDDLDLEISVCGHPFVQTNGKLGLTDVDCGAIRQILSGDTVAGRLF